MWLWAKQVHLGQCVLDDRRDWGGQTGGESSAASGMGTEIEASSLFSTKKMMGLGDRAGGYWGEGGEKSKETRTRAFRKREQHAVQEAELFFGWNLMNHTFSFCKLGGIKTMIPIFEVGKLWHRLVSGVSLLTGYKAEVTLKPRPLGSKSFALFLTDLLSRCTERTVAKRSQQKGVKNYAMGEENKCIVLIPGRAIR